MLRVIFALVFCLIAFRADGHGEFQWIQDRNYKGIDGVHCCGEHDCQYIPDEWIELTRAGYVLHYNGKDYLFNEWGKGLHVTERPDKPPIMCRSIAYDTPRCIFIKPIGS